MGQIIQIVGSALGEPTDFDVKYVETYDPHVGEHGAITVTPDIAKAFVYVDVAAAFEAWRAINKNRPLRPDGKPNRPLTAYTVQFLRTP